MALRPRTPGARALLPVTRSRSSGPLGALLSSPALDVRLLTALQVLQVLTVLYMSFLREIRYASVVCAEARRPQTVARRAVDSMPRCAALLVLASLSPASSLLLQPSRAYWPTASARSRGPSGVRLCVEIAPLAPLLPASARSKVRL